MRLFLLVWLCLLTGCASIKSHVEPTADLAEVQRFWVERNLADNRAVGQKLVRALQARGFEAELGPLTMMPRDAQAVVSFRDRWAWDFGEHMTALEVVVREPRTRNLLARSRFEGPLAMHLNEVDIIDRVLRDLFAQLPAAPAEDAPASTAP